MKAAVTRCGVVLLCVLALGGCSTVKGWFEIDDDEDPRQPVELEKIEQTVKARRLWSSSVGDGQGEGLYRIEPVIGDGRIYAASADGEVKALEVTSGAINIPTKSRMKLIISRMTNGLSLIFSKPALTFCGIFSYDMIHDNPMLVATSSITIDVVRTERRMIPGRSLNFICLYISASISAYNTATADASVAVK